MERIEKLYEKYVNGEITLVEKQELFDRIEKADKNDLRKLADKYLNANVPEDLSDLDEPTEELLERINQYISDRENHNTQRLWLRIAVAAAVLLALTGLIMLFKAKERIKNAPIAQVIKDLAPGGKHATLTLAGGKTILLDNAFAGQLAIVDGISISKTAEGQLVYENNTSGTQSQSNVINIPRGGEYQLLLPDGTKVWLNASTTLQYPTRFTGNERNVKLKGEAYFKVAKDATHPFIVETDKQKIQVLGTHFNVNTYQNDRTITTLEEGSVKVSGSGVTKLLKPGQQSILFNGLLSVSNADMESALAWKNGLLFFKDAPLATVLEEVARWYDIEIEYRTKPTDELFSGSVSRTANLSAILKILKLTGVKTNLVREGATRKLIVE